MAHLLRCELTYFIKLMQRPLLLFLLTLIALVAFFAIGSSHDSLIVAAFDGIRQPGSQRGFTFPIFWLSYYIAPLFF